MSSDHSIYRSVALALVTAIAAVTTLPEVVTAGSLKPARRQVTTPTQIIIVEPSSGFVRHSGVVRQPIIIRKSPPVRREVVEINLGGSASLRLENERFVDYGSQSHYGSHSGRYGHYPNHSSGSASRRSIRVYYNPSH